MDLPESLADLESRLAIQGFELQALEADLPSGERFRDFQRDAVAVRIGRDRDGWYLLIRGPGEEDSWYDASIWRAFLDSKDDPGPTPTVEDSIAFLTTRLASVETAMQQDTSTSKGLEKTGWKRTQEALGLGTDLQIPRDRSSE